VFKKNHPAGAAVPNYLFCGEARKRVARGGSELLVEWKSEQGNLVQQFSCVRPWGSRRKGKAKKKNRKKSWKKKKKKKRRPKTQAQTLHLEMGTKQGANDQALGEHTTGERRLPRKGNIPSSQKGKSLPFNRGGKGIVSGHYRGGKSG